MNEHIQKTSSDHVPFSINVLGNTILTPHINAFFEKHGPYLDELNQLLEDSETDDSDEIDLFLLLINDPAFQEIIAELNSKETIDAMIAFYEKTITSTFEKYLPQKIAEEMEAYEEKEHTTSESIRWAQNIRRGQTQRFKNVNSFMKKFNKGLERTYMKMRQKSRIRAFCLQYLLSKVRATIIANEGDIFHVIKNFIPDNKFKGFVIDASAQMGTIQWLYQCPDTEVTPEQLDPYELIADKALKKQFGPIYIDVSEIPKIKKACIGRDPNAPMSVKFSIVILPEGQNTPIILDVSAFDGSVWNHEDDPNNLQFCLEDLALQYGDKRRQAYLAVKDALIFKIAETIENTDSILDTKIESVLEETKIGTAVDESLTEIIEEITSTVPLEEERLEEEEETDEIEKVLNYRGHARDKDVSSKKITAVARKLGLEVLKNRGKGSHIAIRNPETGILKVLVTTRYKGGKVRFGFVRKLFKELGVEREVFLPHFFKSLRKHTN